jgi:hypothetical protein
MIIASVIIGIVLAAGLFALISNYSSAIARKDQEIATLNEAIIGLNNTIKTITASASNNTGGATVSYIVWEEGSVYKAKNAWTGETEFQDSNFTSLFLNVSDALPSQGGIIHLRPGTYGGWIVIDRDGLTLEGEGASPAGISGIPDNSPTSLIGTVLRVDTPNKDGVHISGQRYGIQILNLGIWFTQPSTGNGISDDMDQSYHCTGCTFTGITILNNDKSHYAIQMSNFLHLDVRDIMAWGGPLLNLYCNKDGFQAGNSNFYNIYGHVKYDLEPINFTNGPYPIFIHKNDSLSDLWMNFLHFYRVQVNSPFGQSDSDYYTMIIWDCRDSTFDGLDFEGTGTGFEGQRLAMGSCQSLTFMNALMWSMNNNLYVNIADNNQQNVFIGCTLTKGLVLDSCATDTWVGCKIDGTIHQDSKAVFDNLPGNSGEATLQAGQSAVNVTAKFIGQDYMVFLQPISNQSLQAGEALKIGAVYNTPTSRFTVTCIDGNPASKDISFSWMVVWKSSKA